MKDRGSNWEGNITAIDDNGIELLFIDGGTSRLTHAHAAVQLEQLT